MTEKEKPVASGRLNKTPDSAVVVYHESTRSYFRPDTEELVFLHEGAAHRFEDANTRLLLLMNDLHMAKAAYSEGIEAFGLLYPRPLQDMKLRELSHNITLAEKNVDSKSRDLRERLGLFDEQKGYAPLVELIPLDSTNKSWLGSHYTYVRRDDYERMVGVGDIAAESLKSGDGRSIYKDDQKSIDIDALTKKLEELRSKVAQTFGVKIDAQRRASYQKILGQWAQSWNNRPDNHYANNLIDLSAGAQFMRFSANAGAMGSWDPQFGELKFKGEAKSALTLATGKAASELYLPDRMGWRLNFQINEAGERAELGCIRVCLKSELTGYAGASVHIEGQLQIALADMQQILIGRWDTSRQGFASRQQTGAVIEEAHHSDKALVVDAEIFGGASAGAALGGALQWQKPFDALVDSFPILWATLVDKVPMVPLQATEAGLHGSDKPANQYTDFASICGSGEAQTGAGAGGMFKIEFREGRFRFKIAASLCIGVGAKGSLTGEVSIEQFNEFGIWLIYQLYGADYHLFTVITKEAFKAFTYMMVMQVAEGAEVYRRYFDDIHASVESVQDDFEQFMAGSADIISPSAALARRNARATLVVANADLIYQLTPEGKAIYLYELITHEGERTDPTHSQHLPLDGKATRAEAVMVLLHSVRTVREFEMILLHMSADGARLSGDRQWLLTQQEQKLATFLQQYGEAQPDDEGSPLVQLKQNLKEKPAFGYPFAPNNSLSYRLRCESMQLNYPRLNPFGPTDIMLGEQERAQ